MNAKIVLLVIVALLPLSWQLSRPSDPSYQAGVVEFVPQKTGKPAERVRANLQGFKDIIESAETANLDILVFPEYVLNNMGHKTYVPDPKDGIAPCIIADYDWFLTELSCAARSRQIYIVFNILEKQLCSDAPAASSTVPTMACDADGLHTFNTNVVMDRQGRVISRYRKTNLYRYEWYDTNVLAEPEFAMFSTDFGVTFGHFICFDMLFYTPALQLIVDYNITDIIYPTYWFSELPFLTAVQMQEGWAYGNNVNLLAADASVPQEQNTGSGIYAGKMGRLNAIIQEVGQTRLLTASVPKRSAVPPAQLPPIVQPAFVQQLETPRFTQMALLRDYNLDIFSSQLLAADATTIEAKVCHQESQFCCDFSGKRNLISQSPLHAAYRYRLVAYSGANTTHQRMDRSALSVCAVVACTGAELYTCGHIFPASVRVGNIYYFSELQVSGGFPLAQRRLIAPSTVDAVMMPLPVTMYEMTQVDSGNQTLVSMKLTAPKLDLLTFGIWANYYHTARGKHNLEPVGALTNGKSNAAAGHANGMTQIYLYSLLLAFVVMMVISRRS